MRQLIRPLALLDSAQREGWTLTPPVASNRTSMLSGRGLRLGLVFAASVVTYCLSGTSARACDICALHSSTVLDPPRPGVSLLVTDQFTSFNTYKKAGGINLPVDEWMQSSVTNVVIGYGFRAPYRVELTIPFINREFRRLKDQSIDRNDESGLGDVSIVGRMTALDRVLTDSSLVRMELFAGFELPTGDADLLAAPDEAEPKTQSHVIAEVPVRPRHGGGGAPTGIHDQDLALGSGSLDMLLGVNTFATWRRGYGTAGVQYAVRGHGAHDYRYDNDLSFYAGLGGYLLVHSRLNLAAEARLNGESKGNDEQDGETLIGSNLTAVYVGPHVHATYSDRLRGSLGVQVPVLQHVSELTLVPDYRILANIGWQF